MIEPERATAQGGTEDEDLRRAPKVHIHQTTSHAVTEDQCAEDSNETSAGLHLANS